MPSNAITVKELKKSYGKNTVLKGLNLAVKKGTILALLGPNGAGKTTTVRILSTLLTADGGEVLINNINVSKSPDKVRELIGLTGQSAAVDELLTGRENLYMMGRLYRLTKQSAQSRAEELLIDFDLTDASNRPAKTYSGGMRRRLDLAVSLIAAPPIIFLDEPTTGLDPRSRIAMWDIINQLKAKGTTILLTTQYLEEADQLADKIAVIDNGVVIAEGTAKELKEKVGKDLLELTFKSAKDFDTAVKALTKNIVFSDKNAKLVKIALSDTSKSIRLTLDKLESHKINPASIDIHKPTLDDVFLNITGKSAKEGEKDEQ